MPLAVGAAEPDPDLGSVLVLRSGTLPSDFRNAGGVQQPLVRWVALLELVHLKSVVVAGKRFCCDPEQHSPPASVRVADQPRAHDDATSL
jgi:hypothetical protein